MELYQIVQLFIAAIIAVLYFIKKFTGVDVLKRIMLSRPVIIALQAACDAVYNIWPERKELKTVSTVMRAAIDGAQIAEKAWKLGNLTKEERNPYAKSLVKETLGNAGIEITPQIAMIIDGVIEAVCIVLPHEKKAPEEENENVPEIRGDKM